MTRGRVSKGTSAGEQEQVFVLRGEIGGRPVRFLLGLGISRLGRGLDNEVVVSDGAVSRRHARVTVGEEGVIVEDLNSRNGTFVNGQRVRRAALRVGDVVSFGPVSLRLELVPVSDAKPVTAVTAGPGEATASMPTRPQGTTSDERWVPGQWVHLIALAHRLYGQFGPDCIQPLLRMVQRSLGAKALVLADVPLVERHVVGDQIAVVAVVGACDVGTFWSKLLPTLPLRDWTETPHEACVFTLNEPEPLVVAAMPTTSSTVRVLVLEGSFPGMELSGLVLKPLMEFFRPPVGPKDQAPRRCPEVQGHAGLVFPPGHVAGVSPVMKALYCELEYVVRGDLPVLITGETGVGKEHVARIIHLSSRRAPHPFLAINCPGTNTELFEAELFGVEARVATGVAKRDGKLKLAHGGTVLLDEIADLPPTVQAKLLRTLQESEIYPVGACRPVKVDVRIIAATNADLPSLIEQGRFRHDLYYRLAGVILRVPPLRERREDIPVLAAAIVQRFAQELGVRIPGLTARAVEILTRAPWPGNVRELEHVLKRAVLLCPPGQPISAELLTIEGPRANQGEAVFSFDGDLNLQWWHDRLERALVEAALARAGGRVGRAAALLGITRQGLAKKMRALGLTER